LTNQTQNKKLLNLLINKKFNKTIKRVIASKPKIILTKVKKKVKKNKKLKKDVIVLTQPDLFKKVSKFNLKAHGKKNKAIIQRLNIIDPSKQLSKIYLVYRFHSTIKKFTTKQIEKNSMVYAEELLYYIKELETAEHKHEILKLTYINLQLVKDNHLKRDYLRILLNSIKEEFTTLSNDYENNLIKKDRLFLKQTKLKGVFSPLFEIYVDLSIDSNEAIDFIESSENQLPDNLLVEMKNFYYDKFPISRQDRKID
jgi:hypothetical protein